MTQQADKKLQSEHWEMVKWMQDHEISLTEKFDLENAPRRKRTKKRRPQNLRDPEDVLDLHGLKVEEALKELRNFIMTSKLRGCYLVKVIHGKGLHSSGEAKLKVLVEEYLNNEAKDLITSWQTAPLEHGGSGAVFVFI